MTTITFYHNDNLYNRLAVEGHTNYKVAGSDILCASISTIAQLVVIGIGIAKTEISNLIIDVDRPIVDIKVGTKDKAKLDAVQILFSSAYEALKLIEKQYSEYMHVIVVEYTEV